MVRTRTKKLRGGHYGRGMKAGRGKGKKGGSGMAGLHKHKWVWTIINDPLHFGGKGFTSHHPSNPDTPITLNELNNEFPRLVARGYAKESKNGYEVDLTSAGYTKLLGSGLFNKKCVIKVEKATEKAISKLSTFGTTVEVNGGGDTAE